MDRLSRQLVEVAWRIVAELVRRYPGRLLVIETHPGGGQYDCLSVYERGAPHDGLHIDLNRLGSAHVHRRLDNNEPGGSWPDFWADVVAATDPKRILDRLCDMAGIPGPTGLLPAETPETLTYRVIASLLNHATFGRRSWECRNGHTDSSDGGGTNASWFALFPATAPALAVRIPDDIRGIPAYRFWFLLEDGSPKLCFETGGTVWDTDGNVHNLAALYRTSRGLSPIVQRVAERLLP